MKIILSESQLKLIIKESINVNRLNYLLDKVSESGIESLSKEEKEDLDDMSNGRNLRKRKHVEPEEKPQSSHQPHSSSSQSDFGSFEHLGNLLNPNKGEDEGEEMEAPLRHFMDFAPKFTYVMIGDTKWGIEPIEDATGPHIKISNGEKEFHVTPFVNNMNRILIDYMNGQTEIFDAQEVQPNEMKAYVKLFYSKAIPVFIRKALKQL